MCSISMCVIQVNKVDLKPTTYYTLTPRNNLKNPSFIQESKKEYPSHAAVATATATRHENPQFTATRHILVEYPCRIVKSCIPMVLVLAISDAITVAIVYLINNEHYKNQPEMFCTCLRRH